MIEGDTGPNSPRERLSIFRDELARDVPRAMEVDLDDPKAELLLGITWALYNGVPFKLVADDEDGRPTSLLVEVAGDNDDGVHMVAFTISGPDDLTSRGAAETIVRLVADHPEGEVRDPFGD